MEDPSVNRPDDRHALGVQQKASRVLRMAIVVGVVAVALSSLTGYLAYQRSRQALIAALSSYNCVVADRLVDEVDASMKGNVPDPYRCANEVLRRWETLPRTDARAFVCVIGSDGKLLAHSIRPEKVGKDVSSVETPDPETSTVGALVRARKNWVGENINAMGKRQIAAYSYSSALNGLVVVHTPATVYEPAIRATVIPWGIGFGVAVFALWPGCLFLTHLAFRRLHGSLTDAHQQLDEQFVELEHVYQTAPVGLAIIDRDLRYKRINECLASMNGLSVEDHIGKAIRDVIPEMADVVEAQCTAVFNTGVPALNMPFMSEDPEDPDSLRYYRVSRHPVNDPAGNIIGVGTIVQDVTDEQRLIEARRAQQMELVHISRLGVVGELVAGIAHEINQPLAAIANYAAATKRAIDSNQTGAEIPVSDWLDQISEQAVACGDIVRNLGSYTSKRDSEQSLFCLTETIRNAVAILEFSSLRQPIEIQICVADRAEVFGNKIQIQQVLVNLLRNACEACENSTTPGVTVRLSANRQHYQIAVEDNGVGIAESDHESVFNTFFTTKSTGIGIGLAISKSIVESHSGQLTFDATYTEGARFCISLPTAALAEMIDSTP